MRKEIRVLRVALDVRRDEWTQRHHGEPTAARVVEREARECAPDTMSLECVRNLGVREHDGVAAQAVVRHGHVCGIADVRLVTSAVGHVGNRDLRDPVGRRHVGSQRTRGVE